MPADPYGAAATGPDAATAGQELRQVRADRHRADAGAAAAVRDAEGLVQVQVRHVGAERRRVATPTSALRLAPSMYTWPPASCTASQIVLTFSS